MMELDDADAQLLAMALSELSLTCPGFDYALSELAKKLGVEDSRQIFKTTRGDIVMPLEGVWTGCPLPTADELQLEQDKLIFGTAYKYKCRCRRWHRLAPESVVFEQRRVVQKTPIDDLPVCPCSNDPKCLCIRCQEVRRRSTNR